MIKFYDLDIEEENTIEWNDIETIETAIINNESFLLITNMDGLIYRTKTIINI